MPPSASDANQPRLRLAIDAVGVRADSGGATVLADLLRASASDARFETILFASPQLLACRQMRADAPLEVEAVAPRNRAQLLWWNLRGLSARAERLGAQAILSLNSLGRARRLPVFVLFQQQLMFEPAAVARLGPAFGLRLRLLSRLARSACRSARLVFTQGEHVSRNVVEHFRVAPQCVRSVLPDITWPDGAAGAAPELPGREPLLLAYVGSAQPHKSLDTLLAAFAELRADSPELQLELTLPRGSVPEQPGAKAVGRLERREVRALLARASILVMPSLAETVGLPLLEALDMGCNVVAADLPYAREVCGNAALYFRPGNARECAARARELLADAGLRDRLRERGRALLEERRRRLPYPRLLQEIWQNMP
ncbi:MAG TPA: glycosyltransferase [Polyangiaceae bacterium]|nr:glycosyltransferase [Polyangiaceae bacterium]